MVKKASILILAVLGLSILLPGCARFSGRAKPDYRTVENGSARNPKRARKKHEKGIDYLQGCCLDLAEQAFQEALICDSSFGPAHNSLGKLYFDQGKYYLSAWEFEHAIKEMPDRAEPVNNLGLVYEAVGKMGEAIIQYQNARLIDPENSQYLGNLLRARIRQGEHPSIMRTELQTLIELDPRKEWVQWAKLQLTTDRTMQDWRHPSVGLTNELPVESNHAESLSFEPVPAGVEITTSDELPVFQLPAETGDKLELETGRQ